MNRFFCFITLSIFLFSCSQKQTTVEDFSSFVNPYIGSDYHGHVFVGANVPFGAVQLGPNNAMEEWDWCSGYHYSDSVLIGFAHTQLSGTGIGDLGDILFMPVSNQYHNSNTSKFDYPWQAHYKHNQEIVEPGYYSLFINDYNIKAELTCSERVGFHKYNFKSSGNSRVIIDLNYGTGWDSLTVAQLEQANKNSVQGYRFSEGWAKNQQTYFYTEFSKNIKSFEIIAEDAKAGQKTVIIEFEGNGELLAKTAISPVNTEGAKNNLQQEINHWDFEATKQAAKDKWNTELSKIKIESDNISDKEIFYTALYHTMIAPSLFNDANGDFRGTNREIHRNPGYETYTTFSLWDTYRAAHPLLTLTQTDRVNDIVNTMLEIYEKQGQLPVWHLQGSESFTMVGNHAIPVITDAYLKGFDGFDPEKAFEAIKNTQLKNDRGLNYIKSHTYIPADLHIESVAMALEYAIDDWCIAAMAKKMGKQEDYELFAKRAKYYQNYFDKETQFMRGKMADGSFRTPFNPIASTHRKDDYCEGNAWQYTWLVPHDVSGLIDLFGGDQSFVKKLDQHFTNEQKLSENASVDISGLVGMYAHGNEPSHHVPYMYAFAGEQWKTAQKARFLLSNLYTNKPDGLCGNEDCGQMSAWYVFSSLGFYPVNPSNGIYVFGSPLFNKASIQLPNKKVFEIETINGNQTNIYIQSVTLNGEAYSKTYISHSDILKGGKLEFKMGNIPNKDFGLAIENRPKSDF